MAVNETAKIYLRSYIDCDATGYTLSGDFTPTANTIDRNKNTYAITSGKETDGESCDFIADMEFDREIDTIVLKSNLLAFTIYYWNGASYVELETYTDNAEEFLVIEFRGIISSKIKITATHTITANEEKKLYMVEITRALGDMTFEKKVSIKKAHEVVSFKNIYGGTVQVVKYPNYGKVEISCEFESLYGDNYTMYQLLKEQRLIDAYNVYLYFSDDFDLLGKEAFYLVSDVSDFESSPFTDVVSLGITGLFEWHEC